MDVKVLNDQIQSVDEASIDFLLTMKNVVFATDQQIKDRLDFIHELPTIVHVDKYHIPNLCKIFKIEDGFAHFSDFYGGSAKGSRHVVELTLSERADIIAWISR